jgi:uncharacterized Zn finger protein
MLGRDDMQPATYAKAERLSRDGSVTRIDDARVYAVEGDHGTYMVLLTNPGVGAWCSCPATGLCSHLAAAGLVEYREAMAG